LPTTTAFDATGRKKANSSRVDSGKVKDNVRKSSKPHVHDIVHVAATKAAAQQSGAVADPPRSERKSGAVADSAKAATS
jgi:hypothetical protein